MGVMACNRTNCESVMCDFYSSDHGYICWKCRDELIKAMPTDIELFMDTPKKSESSVDYTGVIDQIFQEVRY